MSFYRWYTNNPPSGANPNADWWQVSVSDNLGASWTAVENTKTGDRAWRKFAFRIEDYVGVNSTFQIKFVASDSTRLGQYLDGGSLVEAALDDISIWDTADWSLIEESAVFNVNLFPNPAENSIRLNFSGKLNAESTFEIRNQLGQLIQSGNVNNVNSKEIDISGINQGIYYVVIRSGDGRITRPFTKL